MKKINSLVKANYFYMLLVLSFSVLVYSCGKDPQTENPTLPTKPTLSLSAEKPLNGGSAKITVEASNATKIINQNTNQTVVNGSMTVDNVTQDVTYTFIATNTNENGSTSTIEKITVSPYSVNYSKMERMGKVHQVLRKSCVAGTENLPTVVWHEWTLSSCDTIQFFANKTGKVIAGSCRTNPGALLSSPAWNWYDSAENSIDFGAGVWKITFTSNGYIQTQIKNGFYDLEEYRN